MDIIINEEPLDFTLEQESTLGEVMLEIEKWLGQAHLRIRSVTVDGSSIDLVDRTGWDARNIDRIGVLEVTALSPVEFRVEKLESLHAYLSALAETTAPDGRLISELLDDRDAVAEFLTGAVSPEAAERFLSAAERFDSGDAEADGRGALSTFAADMVPIVEARWREIVEPEHTLRRIAPGVHAAVEGLSEVSAHLQNGQDSRAMAQVMTFLEMAQTIMRLLHIMRERGMIDPYRLQINGVDLAQHQSEVVGLLDELSGAIGDGDTITIADLLEYEIGPRFEDMLNSINPTGAPA